MLPHCDSCRPRRAKSQAAPSETNSSFAPLTNRQHCLTNERRRLIASVIKLVVVSATICLSLNLHHVTSTQAAEAKQQQRQLIKYELRFQNEPDMSTVIKQAGQQQIFKCQVRLAPASSHVPSQQQQQRAVPRSSARLVEPTSEEVSALAATAQAGHDNQQELARQNKWQSLSNATISIEWFCDDRKLADQPNAAIINVSLNKTGPPSPGQQQRQAQWGAQRQHGTTKSRLEIKNTLNANQLKLTSRLKLLALRSSDSGRYKCQARAQFRQLPVEEAPVGLPGAKGVQVLEVEQTLDSAHGAHLTVFESLASDAPLSNQSTSSAGDESGAGNAPAPTGRTAKFSPSRQQLDSVQAQANGADQAWPSPFEDDEDLYMRAEPSAPAGLELVSSPAPVANDDTEPGAPASEHQSVERGAYLDWLGAAPWRSAPKSGANNNNNNNQHSNHNNNTETTPATSGQAAGAGNESSFAGRTLASEAANEAQRNSAGVHLGANGLLGLDANQRTRMDNNERQVGRSALVSWRFAKLVRRIVPELSCYTGFGEHYRGNISTSADLRPCLNWAHVRHLLARHRSSASSATAASRAAQEARAAAAADDDDDNSDRHNYCRNPSLDARGPWCFVLATASEGAMHAPIARAPCNIAACSEYLWLYIVAPPLGLLLLLSCLLAVLFKSIKNAHYNSVFAHHQHRNKDCSSASFDSQQANNLCDVAAAPSGHQRCLIDAKKAQGANESSLGALLKRHTSKLLPAFRARPTGLGGAGCSSRKRRNKRLTNKATIGNYLDQDDIFEIVDEIDWSDGSTAGGSNSSAASNQQLVSQSFSPKSGESLRLNHSSPLTVTKIFAPQRPTLSQCKSINPISGEKRLDLSSSSSASPLSKCLTPTEKNSPQLQATSFQRHTPSNGPMFATLRCHMRTTLQPHANKHANTDEQQNCIAEHSNDGKSSSLFNRCDSKANQLSRNSPDKLISYGSNPSQASEDAGQDKDLNSDSAIAASDLPQLDANCVSILYDLQPVFEGKFSQVRMAYMKQQENDSTQATGMVGVQVAVCALKQSASVNEQLFEASRLRLRNLNHLNLLKLIGHIQLSDDKVTGTSGHKSLPCAIVYDMTHLIDLSDWLREQSKDSVLDEMSKDSSSLRQNITCFAKQIALALDYLHDRSIVYKDLACRNCFLDVTKMLVKLASFNLELDIPEDIEKGEVVVSKDKQLSQQQLSLKSMIRPKYLLDYYVIDSRPTECQLLPLSWIPLESILFNKFNKQTDIWSFGCLIYELFTLGEVAYFGYSSKQVIDAVRSNLMPPQPLLCPNGIYKLMCKCLSDIPTLRPNVKQIYEQLNLYSGQCSSFLDHHLCSLATAMCNSRAEGQFQSYATKKQPITATSSTGSMTKTKSYANIVNKASSPIRNIGSDGYDVPLVNDNGRTGQLVSAGAKIPVSKSINLVACSNYINESSSSFDVKQADKNHYDELVLTMMDKSVHS